VGSGKSTAKTSSRSVMAAMAASSEKEDIHVHDEKQLDIETATTRETTLGTKEEVTDATGKEDALSEDSASPESEGHETDEEEQGNERSMAPVRPQSSRASSIFSRSRNVVPRRQRRGLFGRFAVIPEIERPVEYTTKTKWTITAIIALAAAAAPMGAGIFYRMLNHSHIHGKL